MPTSSCDENASRRARFPLRKHAPSLRHSPYAIDASRSSRKLRQAELAQDNINRISTRFLVLSDTHDMDLDTLKLPKADIVLHCGDITEDGGIDQFRKALDALCGVEAELKLVIAGNHDVSLDRNFYLKEGGNLVEHEEAVQIWKSQKAQDANIVLLDEGTHSFTLKSGATFNLYASPYTPKYGISAFQYPTIEDRFNVPTHTPPWAINTSTARTVIPADVDIVMTHGPPKYILDNCADGSSGGCEHLSRAIHRARPLLHCFGHIHRSWGMQVVTWRSKSDRGPVRIVDDDLMDGAAIDEFGEDEGEDEDMVRLPKEFIGLNTSRKRGYASPSAATMDGLTRGEQTLFLNVAMMADGSEANNVPWLVDLKLPS